jgi:hypothetical protein
MTLTAVEALLQYLLLLSTSHDFVANVECTTGTCGALAEAVAYFFLSKKQLHIILFRTDVPLLENT